jgi:hypothetical protein
MVPPIYFCMLVHPMYVIVNWIYPFLAFYHFEYLNIHSFSQQFILYSIVMHTPMSRQFVFVTLIQ